MLILSFRERGRRDPWEGVPNGRDVRDGRKNGDQGGVEEFIAERTRANIRTLYDAETGRGR